MRLAEVEAEQARIEAEAAEVLLDEAERDAEAERVAAREEIHLGLALRATSDRAQGKGGSDVDAGQGEPTAGAIEVDGEGGPEVETEQAVPSDTATAAK